MRRALRFALPLLIVGAALVHPFGLYRQIGLDSTDVILALFGLLAIDTVVERVSLLETLHERMVAISEGLSQKQHQLLMSTDAASEEIARHFHTASTIDLCGMTLGRTIVTHSETLKNRLENGCKIRVCVMDPNPAGPAVLAAAARSANIDTPERMSRHADATVDGIRALHKSISKKHANALELYFLQYPPPYKLIAVNANEDRGVAYVETYACKVAPTEDPAMIMTKATGQWYRFYLEQVRLILASARRVPLP